MARQAEGEEHLLKYLTDIPTDYKCAIGLILGQVSSQKFHIIHLAKTPPFQSPKDKSAGIPLQAMQKISELNDSWVADHARQTTRMLPGGMHILGLFIVSDEELLNPFNSKLRSLLSTIHKALTDQEYLFGNGSNEKLIVHYSGKSKRYLAKSYDVVSLIVQPVDIKFLSKSNKWMNFQFEYQIDHSYYIKENDHKGPLRKHIKVILDIIHGKLEKGIILFDNDFKDIDEKIENIQKKKKVSRGSSNKTADNSLDLKPVLISIFEETEYNELPDKIESVNVDGQIRIVGEVAGKLWLNSRTSIGEVIQAVKEDIMRSLSTRVDMHWDSLTEEEQGEELNIVHEPPRRVLINLPDSNITISDYLFPGEGSEDVKVSLEELLDIKTQGHLEVIDVEGPADISQYYQESSTPDIDNDDLILPQLTTDSNKFKYLVTIGAAVLVLVISILVHFILNK